MAKRPSAPDGDAPQSSLPKRLRFVTNDVVDRDALRTPPRPVRKRTHTQDGTPPRDTPHPISRRSFRTRSAPCLGARLEPPLPRGVKRGREGFPLEYCTSTVYVAPPPPSPNSMSRSPSDDADVQFMEWNSEDEHTFHSPNSHDPTANSQGSFRLAMNEAVVEANADKMVDFDHSETPIERDSSMQDVPSSYR